MRGRKREREREREREYVCDRAKKNVCVCVYVCMYVCMFGHTSHSKSKDQPGKVANPARGQLSKENEYFPVPARA